MHMNTLTPPHTHESTKTIKSKLFSSLFVSYAYVNAGVYVYACMSIRLHALIRLHMHFCAYTCVCMFVWSCEIQASQKYLNSEYLKREKERD